MTKTTLFLWLANKKPWMQSSKTDFTAEMKTTLLGYCWVMIIDTIDKLIWALCFTYETKMFQGLCRNEQTTHFQIVKKMSAFP